MKNETKINDFKEFCNVVKENIGEHLSPAYLGAEITINEVIKNNDQHLFGLTIRKNDAESIAPTLYLEKSYEEYQSSDCSLDDILEKLANIYMRATDEGLTNDTKEIVKNILDFDSVKDKIIPRLINKDLNADRLTKYPHTVISDFATIYIIDLGEKNDGSMSVTISNEMLEKYKVSVRELHKIAISNMLSRDISTIEPIEAVLDRLLTHKMGEMDEEESNKVKLEFNLSETGMHVASNRSKVYGATCILDKEFLSKIYKQLGAFFILPSSVHELIILKKTEEMDVGTLEKMVQEVNATQVAQEEVLSDFVYEYDPVHKTIKRAYQIDEGMPSVPSSTCCAV